MSTARVNLVTATSKVQPWISPPATISLGINEVHVWRAPLDQPSSHIDSFRHTLAADEQTKADRFYFQNDRDHFIAAHGVLRAILGRYLDRAPECLSFCYGSHGKPALVGESGADAIHFNMSHSHGVALYAVARSRAVGIDLEFVRRELEIEQIAERFFSHRETATLRALPADLRRCAFFLCWTRKEAYIKAKGEGLSMPLDRFDVSLVPGEPAALLSTRPDPDETCRWSLRELTLTTGHVAALAVEGRGWSLSCWRWPRPLPSTA